ncbi:MAG: MBL fold metallo-hydrolase [Bdellovibrionaceae bacterium]|nr:MBL fold metallo-hydrolase [Pseudobdellovibrionaceae bacterium]
MIAYDEHVCDLQDRRNWRTRTSAHVVMGGQHLQIDAGPEFRLQCLHNDIRRIDYFFLTHAHSDHVVGMDDLRRFCDLREDQAIPVYSTAEGCDRVRAMYPYAARERPVYKGYPAFHLREMPAVLELAGGAGPPRDALPWKNGGIGAGLRGGRVGGRGWRITRIARNLSGAAWELRRGVDVLVIDGLRPHEHPTHFSIPEAIEAARRLEARKTYLTHLTHHVDHATWSGQLPDGVELAYDGLKVDIAAG